VEALDEGRAARRYSGATKYNHRDIHAHFSALADMGGKRSGRQSGIFSTPIH
jgi:hypothetical protein